MSNVILMGNYQRDPAPCKGLMGHHVVDAINKLHETGELATDEQIHGMCMDLHDCISQQNQILDAEPLDVPLAPGRPDPIHEAWKARYQRVAAMRDKASRDLISAVNARLFAGKPVTKKATEINLSVAQLPCPGEMVRKALMRDNPLIAEAMRIRGAI
jgi:hypothetical protein